MAAKDADRQTIVFTPGYAPLEQEFGHAETRSDLYALAATLFHLVTGRPPKSGPDTIQAIDDLLDDPRQPVPAQHRWFYELLKINLSENVNDRYLSAQDFKADLEKRQITREVRCRKCGGPSPARTPYCSRCAAPLHALVAACNDCGRNNLLGSKYCIYCGKSSR